jgi:DnaJ-class molecular chaperone
MQCLIVHLAVQLSVTYIDAILGREVEVATLRGTACLQVPPGVQHGERLSLADEGISADATTDLGNGRLLTDGATHAGAHHFVVCVRLPEVSV